MKGGLVIPIRNITRPSFGKIWVIRFKSSGKLVLMSRPYAPVSSELNHISLTSRSSHACIKESKEDHLRYY